MRIMFFPTRIYNLCTAKVKVILTKHSLGQTLHTSGVSTSKRYIFPIVVTKLGELFFASGLQLNVISVFGPEKIRLYFKNLIFAGNLTH